MTGTALHNTLLNTACTHVGAKVNKSSTTPTYDHAHAQRVHLGPAPGPCTRVLEFKPWQPVVGAQRANQPALVVDDVHTHCHMPWQCKVYVSLPRESRSLPSYKAFAREIVASHVVAALLYYYHGMTVVPCTCMWMRTPNRVSTAAPAALVYV